MLREQLYIDFDSQPPLPFSGDRLKELGMALSEESANNKVEGWSDMAFEFLKQFIKNNPGEFMGEEVRNASKWIVPQAPSNRAWGSVVLRAAKAGLIKRVGFKSVSNPKAHCAPCSVWVRV